MENQNKISDNQIIFYGSWNGTTSIQIVRSRFKKFKAGNFNLGYEKCRDCPIHYKHRFNHSHD